MSGGGAPALGLDAGGSRTRALLLAPDGRVLGRGEAGPGNPSLVGLELAWAQLRAAAEAACAAAGVALRDVGAVVAGVAGSGEAGLTAWLVGRWREEGYGGPLAVVDDAELVLRAGCGDGPGLAVVAGSGSIVVARDAAGRRLRAGGWGPLAGDEGGARDVGRRVLRAVTRAADGLGPPTALVGLALAQWGVRDARSLVGRLAREGWGALADLAPLAVRAWADGDAVAGALLAEAGSELGALAAALLRRLGDAGCAPVPVALAGGMLRPASPLRQAVEAALTATGLPLRVRVLEPDEPVLAAARAALAAARAAGHGVAAPGTRRGGAAGRPDGAGMAAEVARPGPGPAAGPAAPLADPQAAPAGDPELPTEAVHPAAWDLDSLPLPELLARFDRADAEALAAVAAARDALAALVEAAAAALAAGGRLVYVGAGSSGRIAALDAAEVPPTFGLPARRVVAVVAGGARALRRAVEGAEDDAAAGARAVARLGVGPRDLVVGVSASGRTPFTVAAVEEARRRGARTGAVTAVAGSPLARAAELPVVVATGPELVAGSTRLKAGTAQKLVLHRLSTAAMVRLGRVHGPYMVGLRPVNAKLYRRAVALVRHLAGVGEEEARRALAAAGGRVAVAVLALRAGLPPRRAARVLARAGSLRAALAQAGGAGP